MPRSQEFAATIMPKIIHADHGIFCFCNFLYTRVEMMFCIGKGSQKMESFYGICHEGGGVSGAIKVFKKIV